ncbi:serine/threonine-protein kinase [Kitasatospora sp. NPDC052868]|uniref:serine/threonine-protein kinase n=1 Tax=Kitasatospora sp. NPDC052868 TaxID=3364060 RepID=UPI0037CB361D
MERTPEHNEPHEGRPSIPSRTRIAGYELENEIGRGRTGTVYRATDLRLGRTLAVKLLAPELGRDEAFRRRFVRDSRIAAEIDHPHIVPVMEAGEADGFLYIAMRYVAGPSLRELLAQDGTLSVDGAVRIAGQVASALDSAHAHGVVHGGVNPGSILVIRTTDEERPQYAYLTDFGIDIRTLTEDFTRAVRSRARSAVRRRSSCPAVR